MSPNSTTPTRLWLASPHFYPTYGGGQLRYRSYIPGLSQRGLDVHILTGTPKGDERSEGEVGAQWYKEKPGNWLPESELDGVPLHRIRLPDWRKRARNRCYFDALLEVCERSGEVPQVVQMLGNLTPQAMPWLRRLKASGVAVSRSVSVFPTWTKSTLKHRLRRRGFQKVFNEFDGIVTNSEAIAAFLREVGVTSKLDYIPNGVNLRRFHPATSEEERLRVKSLRERLGIPDGHVAITAVGAVMPRKGQEIVLEAWSSLLSRFPDTHIVLVGPRADQNNPKFRLFGAQIQRIIRDSGAADRVHFVGLVDDVEEYLRASDLFVLASSREGTPNSVLEAMATGVPAVVTPYAGISSSIGVAGDNYLLAQRTPEDVARALGELLADESARRELGGRGLDFVARHADQEHSLDRYTQMYESLASVSAQRLALKPK